MNLNHIHLHVADVSRAAAFYQRYFGMRELTWHGDMVFMRDAAGMDLALAPNGPKGPEPFPSWFHIGFRLDGRAEVEALYECMKSEGSPIREAVTTEGPLTYFKTADPDGYQVEVYYEPDP